MGTARGGVGVRTAPGARRRACSRAARSRIHHSKWWCPPLQRCGRSPWFSSEPRNRRWRRCGRFDRRWFPAPSRPGNRGCWSRWLGASHRRRWCSGRPRSSAGPGGRRCRRSSRHRSIRKRRHPRRWKPGWCCSSRWAFFSWNILDSKADPADVRSFSRKTLDRCAVDCQIFS